VNKNSTLEVKDTKPLDTNLIALQNIHNMADYDSDSSGAEDIETGVTLGYATKDATGDDFSQLGGHPVSNFVFAIHSYRTTTDKLSVLARRDRNSLWSSSKVQSLQRISQPFAATE
jgi:hypothetical protein